MFDKTNLQQALGLHRSGELTLVHSGKRRRSDRDDFEIWTRPHRQPMHVKSTKAMNWPSEPLEVRSQGFSGKETQPADRFLSTFALIVSQLNHFLVLTYSLKGFLSVGNLMSDTCLCWRMLLLFFFVFDSCLFIWYQTNPYIVCRSRSHAGC